MRPRTLDEVVGQEKLLGQASLCARKLNMTILAPCSSGDRRLRQNTLARLIARLTRRIYSFQRRANRHQEIKEVMRMRRAKRAPGERPLSLSTKCIASTRRSRKPFFPHVEAGHIPSSARPRRILPSRSFPLLSRTKVYILDPLTTPQIVDLLRRALADKERGLGNENHSSRR